VESKWRLIERLVSIIEKAISPVAEVRHNVHLPVLGRPDREPRQCDIVITSGVEPRRTVTIVEVQDRKSKPDINTFHGWVRKMQEVGAQHLICVSALGYPESIVNDVALRYGPTVRLMTLQELEERRLPGLVFERFLYHRTPSFSFESYGSLKLESKPADREGIELHSNEPIFSIDENEELLSLSDLVTQVLKEQVAHEFANNNTLEPTEYLAKLSLGSTERALWLHIEGERFKVLGLDVTVKVTSRIDEIPLSLYSYRQEFYEGELCWASTATGKVGDKDVEIHVLFRPNEEGYLSIVSVHVKGVEDFSISLFKSQEDLDAATNIYRK
jgi:hypothetical protein